MKKEASPPGTYIRLLPSIFQKAPESEKESFWPGFLKIFERIWGNIEDKELRGFIFSIPTTHAAQMDKEEIPEEVQKNFTLCAHSLSKNATLSVQEKGAEWILLDHDQKYYFTKADGQIHAYVEGKKGLLTSLAMLADLFHPRFSFLCSPFETSFLPPLNEKYEKELFRYFSSHTPFREWLDEYLSWLAQWMALTLREHWSLQKKRAVIAQIIPPYRMRGTKRGLEKYLKIYVGERVSITEPLSDFRLEERSIVDGPNALEGSAYFFIVDLDLPRMTPNAMKMTIKTLEEIIDTEKPAHTFYKLNVHTPTMHVQEEGTSLETDTILGE